MFRYCITLFLLLAFLASSFSKAVIVVDFYTNQDFIVKTLCINKDKPMMHCCGRCQLRKRLARENNQDKTNSRSENKNEDLFQEGPAATLTAPMLTCTTLPYSIHGAQRPVEQYAGIFHPPA